MAATIATMSVGRIVSTLIVGKSAVLLTGQKGDRRRSELAGKALARMYLPTNQEFRFNIQRNTDYDQKDNAG
jgi:hypothetical protein